MMIQAGLLILGLVFLLAVVINVVTAIFRGGFDDVDTRPGPRRRFPK